jgi:DNA-binding NtrC family response regulator
MSRNKVLLVDDDEGVRFGIRDFLETHGYEVEEAQGCGRAQELFLSFQPDVAIIDYRLPDGTALELMPRLKAIDPGIPLVVLTGHGSIDLAVRAIKEGAEQFFTKPIELPALLIMLQRLLENQRNRQKQLVDKSLRARQTVDPFIGTSAAIRELQRQAGRLLSTEYPIMVQGPTGTGKGVLANWLHQNGPRADEAFVDLNCAALPEELLETEIFGYEKGAFTGAAKEKPGLFEIAHRGTVFLDEVGDVSPQVQPKLLKVLEEKKLRRVGGVRDRQVDIRLIAATSQDLKQLMHEKRFRSDLYFRISTIVLNVPALRDRGEDITLLARHLLDRIAHDLGRGNVTLSPEAERALQSHTWPGNIRELRNVLERAVLLSDHATLLPGDLYFDSNSTPGAAPAGDEGPKPPSQMTLQELEQWYIAQTLSREQGNVEQAALRLGIPRSSLYQKIKKFQIATSRG